jgi:hypothetical protein
MELESKFDYAFRRAIPSVDPVKNGKNGNNARTYLVGGYIRLVAQMFESQTDGLCLSISVCKMRRHEFTMEELQHMISSSSYFMLTGVICVVHDQIMIVDEVTESVMDEFSAFSAYINDFMETYWAVRKHLLNIKEQLIRQERRLLKIFQKLEDDGVSSMDSSTKARGGNEKSTRLLTRRLLRRKSSRKFTLTPLSTVVVSPSPRGA